MREYGQGLPRRSLSFALIGLGMLAMFGVLAVFVDSWAGDGSAPSDKLRFLLFASPVFALAAFWVGRDVFAYLLGHRQSLVLGQDALIAGGKSYRYQAITALIHDLDAGRLDVLAGGERLRIREDLYPEFDDFHDRLYHQIASRLIDEARTAMRTGPVAFGKRVALSHAAIKIGRQSAPLDSIKKARTFRTNDSGALSEELIVELHNGDKIKIRTNKVPNLPILLSLLGEMCSNLKTGL